MPAMKTVTMDELRSEAASLLDQVEAGARLVVVRDGRAIAEIRPLESPSRGACEVRPIGLAAGLCVVPADFDEPLPGHILSGFESR